MGQHHHLPAIRRIGADLLVADHGRAEDHLAVDVNRGPERSSDEDGPIFQHQGCLAFAHCGTSWTTSPPTMVVLTRPRNRSPCSGEFRPFDRNLRTSTVHSAPGSMTTRSAAAPTASVPASSPNTWAGL